MADETEPVQPEESNEEMSVGPEGVDGSDSSQSVPEPDQSAKVEVAVEPTEARPAEGNEPDVKIPQFAALQEGGQRSAEAALDRFYEVHVPISAELGRIELPLGELVRLTEGAVLRLERPVSEPVDLVSQGVKLARGEVIVIDDCFAVRIKEIVSSK